jgi:hypothetical protein
MGNGVISKKIIIVGVLALVLTGCSNSSLSGSQNASVPKDTVIPSKVDTEATEGNNSPILNPETGVDPFSTGCSNSSLSSSQNASAPKNTAIPSKVDTEATEGNNPAPILNPEAGVDPPIGQIHTDDYYDNFPISKIHCLSRFKEGFSVIDYMDGLTIIDKTGKRIAKTKFENIEEFSEGLAVFRQIDTSGNSKEGYIDSNGKIIIDAQFAGAYPFEEGRAKVLIGKRFGYIDVNGKYLIEPIYNTISNFWEGNAIANKDTKYLLIDKYGKEVKTIEGIQGFSNFSEGISIVSVEQDGKEQYGAIDFNGNWLIKPQYDRLLVFSDGLAQAEINNKKMFVDNKGKVIFNCEEGLEYSCSFKEGLLMVYKIVKSNDGEEELLCGFVDNKGQIVIEPMFEGASDFSDGLALVQKSSNEKIGYIDKTGKFIIQPNYDKANSFSDGLAAVFINELEDSKHGYIDKTGKIVIVIPENDLK